VADEPAYFNDLTGEASEPGRFMSVEKDLPAMEIIPGLTIRPLFGRDFSVNFVRWDADTAAAEHAHPEEQLIVVLDGELEVEFGGQKRTLGAGDTALLPPWVSHSARTHRRPAYQLDVFCPPRQSVIDLMAALGVSRG
jgi:mannose-6-phosphate isomerase-like protein (cupin superfamily)